MRTTQNTIEFFHSFRLAGVEGILPAGKYLVDTDEDKVQTLSHTIYRRVATYLYTKSSSNQMLRVCPIELGTALLNDRRLVGLEKSDATP